MHSLMDIRRDGDVVNGKEYSRRLRKQYERLYPAPDWAVHAMGKKRRRAMDDDESDEGSGSDMDMDEDISSQPLAKLLKDADILSRNSRAPTKRRKLQAGTVDIQRLKDVMKSGPVSNYGSSCLWNMLTIRPVCCDFAFIPSHVPPSSLIRP